MRATKLQKVVSGNLRLLVLIRESLRAEGTPEDSPLLKAVVDQANMAGWVLPNSMRVSETELAAIRKGAGLVMKTNPPSPVLAPPKPGEMMILKPGQIPFR